MMCSALPEDVDRAIELKNGSIVVGRKIAVKQATHRPSLQERRSKAAQGLESKSSIIIVISTFTYSLTSILYVTLLFFSFLGISLPEPPSEPPSDKGSSIPETDKQGISLPRFGF